MNPYPEDDDELITLEDLEFEMALQACGLQADGLCLNVGTEHCNFECPFHKRLRNED